MMVSPPVSVIVLTWNGKAYIAKCLESLLPQDYPEFEVVVVDNGSVDGTPDLVAERFPGVCLIRNLRNLGFAAGNNAGLRMATGQVMVLLNQDTETHPGFLKALAHPFDDPEVGLAGCKLLYPDGTIQHAGGYVFGPRGETGHAGRGALDDGQFDQPSEPEFVTAAALAISRPCLSQIGPLDASFSPAYYEDVDWCYRARAAGFRVAYVPEAVVTHHESATADHSSHQHKTSLNHGRLRFLLKHWPLDRLLDEFGPAETAWVTAMPRITELMAARGAYLKALLTLPGIVAFRGSSGAEAEALTTLLVTLRAAALASLQALVEEQVPATLASATPPVQSSRSASAAVEHRPAPAQAGLAPSPEPESSRATLSQLWTGLRHLPVLPDLVRHVQQHEQALAQQERALAEREQALAEHERALAEQEQALAQQEQALAGMRDVLGSLARDVAQNIRELTAMAEQLARLETSSREERKDG